MDRTVFKNGERPQTIVEVLRLRALSEPDRCAYVFLRNGIREEAQITYKELHTKACLLALHLQQKHQPCERVVLVFPTGLDFVIAFFGCLYAGLIPIPVPPPDPVRLKRTFPRFQAIIRDSQPSLILTTSKIFFNAQEVTGSSSELGDVPWTCLDLVSFDGLNKIERTVPSSDSIAVLQYTSGSTADPKGVMVTHDNLMHQFRNMTRAGGFTQNSVTLNWMPHFHDYGLINGILLPVFVGCKAYLMSTLVFLKHPVRWLEVISRFGVTHSGGPNFAYEACVRNSTPEQRVGLNLHGWEVASCGAEPIRASTFESFYQMFSAVGFRKERFFPCYGLAESTLLVAGKPYQQVPMICHLSEVGIQQGLVDPFADTTGSQKPIVACGNLIDNTNVVIVDPEKMYACPPNQVGEIWLSGPSVAKGYWNRPEETKEIFYAYLQDTGEGPFLRTGDLGFIHRGQLCITGRLKDLIIIHGTNHYPQDIEATVGSCDPSLRVNAGIAFSIEKEGDERLIIAQEMERRERSKATRELATSIREAVADKHNLHVYEILFVRTGSLPKTTSGKVRRAECRKAYLSSRLDVLERSLVGMVDDGEGHRTIWKSLENIPDNPKVSELESWISDEVAQLLGVPSRQIGSHDTLRSLGLDSLMGMELKNRLEKEFRISVSLKDVLMGPAIGQLAHRIIQEYPEITLPTQGLRSANGRQDRWEEGEI